MLSGKLWPVHPHPLPNELLSSWLVRTAHANGAKVQSFTHSVFGSSHEVWNRDIDRLGPDWIVRTMAEKTATPLPIAYQTTLKRYEGILFDHSTTAGIAFWIGSLNMYHRKRRGYGLSFCPLCLSEDAVPYFRTSWRIALQTFCPKHHIMMHDRCPECYAPITYHRLEMGMDRWNMSRKLSTCSCCGNDLAMAPNYDILIIDKDAHNEWSKMLKSLENNVPLSQIMLERLRVLHQLTKVLTSVNHSRPLLNYLETQLHLGSTNTDTNVRFIEALGAKQRHLIIGLAWWLLQDWPKHLKTCWLHGVVRYNYLLKDFDNVTDWYKNSVSGLTLHYKKRENILNDLLY